MNTEILKQMVSHITANPDCITLSKTLAIKTRLVDRLTLIKEEPLDPSLGIIRTTARYEMPELNHIRTNIPTWAVLINDISDFQYVRLYRDQDTTDTAYVRFNKDKFTDKDQWTRIEREAINVLKISPDHIVNKTCPLFDVNLWPSLTRERFEISAVEGTTTNKTAPQRRESRALAICQAIEEFSSDPDKFCEEANDTYMWKTFKLETE